MTDRSEVLFIGGRSGVGKTSAALALHAELARRDIRHAVIDGDNLDLAYPVPWASWMRRQPRPQITEKRGEKT